jgi:YHS domain-containing protein
MPTRRWLLVLATLVAGLAFVRPVLAEELTRVDAKRVCMVNNTRFEKDQIPVAVAGKTYFGCCEMCKGRLAQDAAIREATDPVSGKSVDKATAVLGATPEGKVLYFESEKTFAAYQKRKHS